MKNINLTIEKKTIFGIYGKEKYLLSLALVGLYPYKGLIEYSPNIKIGFSLAKKCLCDYLTVF